MDLITLDKILIKSDRIQKNTRNESRIRAHCIGKKAYNK